MEPLLNPREVAKLLGVSAAWVRDHATRRNPRIPVVKLGSLLRFRLVDVETFVEQNAIRDTNDEPANEGTAQHA